MQTEKEVRYDPQTGEKIVTEEIVGADRPIERIVEKPVVIKKRAGFGTWLGGAVVGAIVAAGAYAYLAHEEGSYSAAGAVVDQKVDTATQSAADATENAGDALKSAGQQAKDTAAQPQPSQQQPSEN